MAAAWGLRSCFVLGRMHVAFDDMCLIDLFFVDIIQIGDDFFTLWI